MRRLAPPCALLRRTLPVASAILLLAGAGTPAARAATVAARFVGPGTAWTDPTNWSPALPAAPDNDAGADRQFDVTISAPECQAGTVVLSGADSPIEIDRLTLDAGCRLEVHAGSALHVLREADLGGNLVAEGGEIVVQGRRVLAADPIGSGPIALSVRDGGSLDLGRIDRLAAPSVALSVQDATLRLGGTSRTTTVSIEVDASPGGPGATLALSGTIQILAPGRLVASSSDVTLSGLLRHDQTDPARFDLSNATVTTTRAASIEPAGLDVGTDCALLPDANFGIGRLVVGAAEPSEVVFRGGFDNGRGGGLHGREAVYLFGPGTGDPCARSGGDGLVVAPGSRVIVDPGSPATSVYAYQASTAALVRLNDLVPTSGPACVTAFGGELCRPGLFEDFDSDGVEAVSDNCSTVRNGPAIGSPQLDADGDGYGDACDADYDQNGSTTAADFGIFLGRFGRTGDRMDHNGDGYVSAADFGTYLLKFAGPGSANQPGPSWLACADPTIDVGAGDPPCEPGWTSGGFP